MLRIKAGAYSFENANVRHEHEYHLWEEVKLPDGKKLIPGMLLHACNIVEHPELIEVHPTVVWAKFQALSEGAGMASRRLWPAKRAVKRGASRKRRST